MLRKVLCTGAAKTARVLLFYRLSAEESKRERRVLRGGRLLWK